VEGVLATLDQNLVEIILSNLLSNAVKYSPAGAPVTLKFRKEGSALVFDVEDRGIGIPSFDQASLFSPFRRGSNVGKVPGTGLGLAIVQKCVQQHGGKIEVRSDEGEGTVFTVWLPGPP
jgi:signal transduction histidine kinase